MKFLLLISLCLFQHMKTTRIETRIVSANETQTGALDEIKAAQIVTNKLLQDYLNKTDTLLKQLVAKEGQVTTAKVCTGEFPSVLQDASLAFLKVAVLSRLQDVLRRTGCSSSTADTYMLDKRSKRG